VIFVIVINVKKVFLPFMQLLKLF